jgi:hypothetical protein
MGAVLARDGENKQVVDLLPEERTLQMITLSCPLPADRLSWNHGWSRSLPLFSQLHEARLRCVSALHDTCEEVVTAQLEATVVATGGYASKLVQLVQMHECPVLSLEPRVFWWCFPSELVQLAAMATNIDLSGRRSETRERWGEIVHMRSAYPAVELLCVMCALLVVNHRLGCVLSHSGTQWSEAQIAFARGVQTADEILTGTPDSALPARTGWLHTDQIACLESQSLPLQLQRPYFGYMRARCLQEEARCGCQVAATEQLPEGELAWEAALRGWAVLEAARVWLRWPHLTPTQRRVVRHCYRGDMALYHYLDLQSLRLDRILAEAAGDGQATLGLRHWATLTYDRLVEMDDVELPVKLSDLDVASDRSFVAQAGPLTDVARVAAREFRRKVHGQLLGDHDLLEESAGSEQDLGYKGNPGEHTSAKGPPSSQGRSPR